MIAPHPYFPGLHSLFGALNRHADIFDAVERNAMYTASLDFNRPAERWAHTTSRWSGTATCIGSSSSTPHTHS